MTEPDPIRVLIPFAASGYLYGMERAVIETFDLLRPEVEPLFIVSRYQGDDLPTLREIRRRGMRVEFFSDYKPWPRIEKPRSLSQFFRLCYAIVQGNLDVLRHAHGCDAIYLAGTLYTAYALAAIPQIRRIMLAHHELAPRHQRRLDIVNALVTDHIHVSDFAAQWTLARNPAIAAKNNAVLIHRTDPPAQSVSALAPGINIVCISQMTYAKGIDLLLEAFQQVRAEHPEAQLHLVGTGDPIAPAPNVHVWGFRPDPGSFLKQATFLVQPTPPSRYQESWGRSAVEAIVSGVPVVCFPSGALPEVVRDGVTGLICRDGNLAATMLRYVNEPGLRDAHAANCHAEDRFSAPAIKRAWLEFYCSSMGRRK